MSVYNFGFESGVFYRLPPISTIEVLKAIVLKNAKNLTLLASKG
jgi:hypothetical protein